MKNLIFLLVTCTLYLVVPSVHARKSAALIIGGYSFEEVNSPIQSSVELFGCTDSAGDSISLNNFPIEHYLSSGVYISDEDQALVCGGYSCVGTTSCQVVNSCYAWDATIDQWSPAPSLAATRFNYLMTESVNLLKPEQGKVPLVLGNGAYTEIWDASINGWVAHLDITDRNWYALGCLINYRDKIYSLRDSVVELDPATWSITEIDSLPTPLLRTARCAGITIDGNQGIMTAHGYWYDLDNRTWHKKAAPPVERVAYTQGSIWSYRGQATIFGHPICNDTGYCNNTGVYQYKPEKDSWVNIGSRLHSKIYENVIEVPGEVCDHFVAPSKMDHNDGEEIGNNYRKAAADTVFRRGLHG